MTLGPAALALALFGCWGTGDAPAPPSPAWTPPADPEHVVPFLPASGVAIRVQTSGLNATYRSHVADPAFLAPLAAALDPCVDDTATLSVSYAEGSRDGRVALVLPVGSLDCHITVGADGTVDLSGLVPVAKAVAAYRNTLASTRDMRIYAWKTAIHVEDVHGHATLWLEGQDPIDGTAFDPCVGLDRVEACLHEGLGRFEGTTTLTPATPLQRRRLTALLGG